MNERISIADKVAWLSHQGVAFVDNAADPSDYYWLNQIGVLKRFHSLVGLDIVSRELFPDSNDKGGGWISIRGNAESYYKICRLITANPIGIQETKFIATKAIISMGDIQSRTIDEVVRLTLLHKYNRAPKVYAYSQGTVYKDFLLEDRKINLDEEIRDSEELAVLFGQLGIKMLIGGKVLDMSIMHKGKLKVIDGGSGDLSGPDYLP